MKYVFVHAVIGDYSWISCAGVNDDEAVLTAGVVLVRGCRLVRSPWSRFLFRRLRKYRVQTPYRFLQT